jgi:D-beta-D-heptose 7-phosphate kinase/D-beta-D-heptose 1-phosphate adenosyltransferase
MLQDTQQQKPYKVLLVGEICQDVYVFGDVNRLSPEAPVPVLKKSRKEYKQGMAGNVCKNIQEMANNAEVHFYCNSIQKIKKIRYIDEKSNYQIMRYDIENELEALNIEDISHETYDLVVISDYNKGYLTEKTISSLCTKFKDSKIFVDTKRQSISSFHNCVIKFNEMESNAIKQKPVSVEIITTLGAKGCSYLGENYPVEKVEVHDVCGAGDVFLAALAVRWLETKDMIKAIKTANNCASLSVTKLGCYTVSRREYEKLCV